MRAGGTRFQWFEREDESDLLRPQAWNSLSPSPETENSREAGQERSEFDSFPRRYYPDRFRVFFSPTLAEHPCFIHSIEHPVNLANGHAEDSSTRDLDQGRYESGLAHPGPAPCGHRRRGGTATLAVAAAGTLLFSRISGSSLQVESRQIMGSSSDRAGSAEQSSAGRDMQADWVADRRRSGRRARTKLFMMCMPCPILRVRCQGSWSKPAAISVGSPPCGK